jgi:hypothetical protein
MDHHARTVPHNTTNVPPIMPTVLHLNDIARAALCLVCAEICDWKGGCRPRPDDGEEHRGCGQSCKCRSHLILQGRRLVSIVGHELASTHPPAGRNAQSSHQFRTNESVQYR